MDINKLVFRPTENRGPTEKYAPFFFLCEIY